MAVTNIAQGANKQLALLGVKEMQARIKTIVDAASGDDAARVAGEAATLLRDGILAAARSVGLPRRAQADIFVYTRQPNSVGRRASITALAGIRKRGRNIDAKGYVTWLPGKQVGSYGKDNRTRKKNKGGQMVIPGYRNKTGALQRIGESLATMWEFGTTKMQAKPFFRPTVTAYRGQILFMLASGYRQILERHAA